ESEIEYHRGGHDGDLRHAHIEPDVPLLQVPHDPARRVEAEGASPGQEYRVDLFDHVGDAEGVNLPGPRGAPPDVDPTGGALIEENHRTPGAALVIGAMADADTLYVRYGILHGLSTR